MASLKLNHIYKIYSGNVTAVSDFCLDIEDKEFIVLVGPSGCGKSTTLRMVAGLEEHNLYDRDLKLADLKDINYDRILKIANRGLPSNEWVEELISNLEWRFNLKGSSENVVSFEQNQNLKGLDKLSIVLDATSNHTPLIVLYKNFKEGGVEENVTLHPYYVKQYNNRWFLFGLNQERNQISNLALDRILSVAQSEDVRFIPNMDVDFEHYFDDVVGVTIPKDEVKKEHIILQFTKHRFPYVTSKPIHHSQETISEEDCTISIDVRPNRELTAQLLSFGPDVEILSPDSVRDRISKKIEENFKKYFPMQDGCTQES